MWKKKITWSREKKSIKINLNYHIFKINYEFKIFIDFLIKIRLKLKELPGLFLGEDTTKSKKKKTNIRNLI